MIVCAGLNAAAALCATYATLVPRIAARPFSSSASTSMSPIADRATRDAAALRAYTPAATMRWWSCPSPTRRSARAISPSATEKSTSLTIGTPRARAGNDGRVRAPRPGHSFRGPSARRRRRSGRLSMSRFMPIVSVAIARAGTMTAGAPSARPEHVFAHQRAQVGIRRLDTEPEETQSAEQQHDVYEANPEIREHRMDHVRQDFDDRNIEPALAAGPRRPARIRARSGSSPAHARSGRRLACT